MPPATSSVSTGVTSTATRPAVSFFLSSSVAMNLRALSRLAGRSGETIDRSPDLLESVPHGLALTTISRTVDCGP